MLLNEIAMKKKLLLMLSFVISLFAQAQWTSNSKINTLVTDTTGSQVYPKIIQNQQSGRGFISWFSEFGDNNYDVYLQKLTKEGELLWNHQGLLISDHPTDSWYTDYGLMIDDENFAIIANQDYRTGNSNVFAYRISPSGEFMWGYDGVQLSNNEYFNPSPTVIQDDNKDYIFAWTQIYYVITMNDTTEKAHVTICKLDKEHYFIWDENVSVNIDSINFYAPLIVPADKGDFFLLMTSMSTHPDTILGETNYQNVSVQKFDADGRPYWTEPAMLNAPKVIPEDFYVEKNAFYDEKDGIYVVWQSFEEQRNMIRVQHLDQYGNILWDEGGKAVSTVAEHPGENFTAQHNIADSSFNIYWKQLMYDEQNMVCCKGIYGQQFNKEGHRTWSDTGKMFVPYVCSSDTNIYPVGSAKHPGGDNLLVYTKEFLYANGNDTLISNIIYAGRINMDAELAWDKGFIPVCDTATKKQHFFVSKYSNAQWIIAWEDNRENIQDPTKTGIYMQNIMEEGSLGSLQIAERPVRKNIRLNVTPNPVKDIANINIESEEKTKIELLIFDQMGNKISSIYRGEIQKGSNIIKADLSLSSGVYYLLLKNGIQSISEKIIVVE